MKEIRSARPLIIGGSFVGYGGNPRTKRPVRIPEGAIIRRRGDLKGESIAVGNAVAESELNGSRV